MSDIDGGIVRAYVSAKRAEGVLGARSINSTLRVLSLVCAEAVEDGYLQANPVTRTRLVKTRKPARGWLEPDELADLLDACTEKSRTLVAVMALAGLRVSEAAGLRWRSVDLANGRLTVEASKTDAGRRVIRPEPGARRVAQGSPARKPVRRSRRSRVRHHDRTVEEPFEHHSAGTQTGARTSEQGQSGGWSPTDRTGVLSRLAADVLRPRIRRRSQSRRGDERARPYVSQPQP
jgi:integrase